MVGQNPAPQSRIQNPTSGGNARSTWQGAGNSPEEGSGCSDTLARFVTPVPAGDAEIHWRSAVRCGGRLLQCWHSGGQDLPWGNAVGIILDKFLSRFSLPFQGGIQFQFSRPLSENPIFHHSGKSVFRYTIRPFPGAPQGLEEEGPGICKTFRSKVFTSKFVLLNFPPKNKLKTK